MNLMATVPILAAAVAVVVVASVMYGGPGEDEIDDYDLPEGFSFSGGMLSRTDGSVISWHIFDDLHTYISDTASDMEVYEGYDVVSSQVPLSPGRYAVSAAGADFIFVAPGDIRREAVWVWGGHDGPSEAKVEFSMDVRQYLAEHDASKERNRGSYHHYDNLTKGVVRSGVTGAIASQLESEYSRLGNDASDRQGLADFVASFVQFCIEYPPTVPGHPSDYDYYVWGPGEYWGTPMETLYHMMGDCDDNAALLCALYSDLGYRTAMGGTHGHVFAGVEIPGFRDRTDEELSKTRFTSDQRSYAPAILGHDRYSIIGFGDTVYQSVESIYKEFMYVGYLGVGRDGLSYPGHQIKTLFHGWAGFYECAQE